MEFYISAKSRIFAIAAMAILMASLPFISHKIGADLDRIIIITIISAGCITVIIRSYIEINLSKIPLFYINKCGIKYRSTFSRNFVSIEWKDVEFAKIENRQQCSTYLALQKKNYEVISIEISNLTVNKIEFTQYFREFSPFTFI